MSLPPRLILASRNAGKLREFRHLLADLNLDILGLDAFPSLPPVLETGSTFEENARLKARAIQSQTGGWVIADDSGLCVDALGGAPGVFSARYAGEQPSDADNLARLLAAVRDVPTAQRTAKFICVLVLATETEEVCFTGVCTGMLTSAPRGSYGFGYDPLFIPTGDTRTFAEMTPTEKAAYSHRSRAACALMDNLRMRLGNNL
ncbi:MAG: RdgB/HAM1 family non-canonical purine NTP pyrophosphatase [Acidobacteriota bacterium]